MPQSVIELAKELTLALVGTGNIPPEHMQDTLQETYATLTALKAQEEAGALAPTPQPFQHVYGGPRAQTLCGRRELRLQSARSKNEAHLSTFRALVQQFRC